FSSPRFGFHCFLLSFVLVIGPIAHFLCRCEAALRGAITLVLLSPEEIPHIRAIYAPAYPRLVLVRLEVFDGPIKWGRLWRLKLASAANLVVQQSDYKTLPELVSRVLVRPGKAQPLSDGQNAPA